MKQYLVQAEQAYYMGYPNENSSYPNAVMVFNQGLGIYEAQTPQEAIQRAIRDNGYLYAVKVAAYPIKEKEKVQAQNEGYFGYPTNGEDCAITVPLMDFLGDADGFDDPQIQQLVCEEHTVPTPRITIDCSASPIHDYKPDKATVQSLSDSLQCILGNGRWYSEYVVDVVNPVNKRQKALIQAWKLGRI